MWERGPPAPPRRPLCPGLCWEAGLWGRTGARGPRGRRVQWTEVAISGPLLSPVGVQSSLLGTPKCLPGLQHPERPPEPRSPRRCPRKPKPGAAPSRAARGLGARSRAPKPKHSRRPGGIRGVLRPRPGSPARALPLSAVTASHKLCSGLVHSPRDSAVVACLGFRGTLLWLESPPALEDDHGDSWDCGVPRPAAGAGRMERVLGAGVPRVARQDAGRDVGSRT